MHLQISRGQTIDPQTGRPLFLLTMKVFATDGERLGLEYYDTRGELDEEVKIIGWRGLGWTPRDLFNGVTCSEHSHFIAVQTEQVTVQAFTEFFRHASEASAYGGDEVLEMSTHALAPPPPSSPPPPPPPPPPSGM